MIVMATVGYCVKCRTNREMKGAVKVKMGKRFAMRGECPKCKTNMFRFV